MLNTADERSSRLLLIFDNFNNYRVLSQRSSPSLTRLYIRCNYLIAQKLDVSVYTDLTAMPSLYPSPSN